MVNYSHVPIDIGTGPGGTDGDTSRDAATKLINDLAQIFSSLAFDSTTDDVTVKNIFVLGAEGSATIAAGVITATRSRMIIDTESAAATDDLDTINGFVDGALLIIRQLNSARDITYKDGVGNLSLAGDFTPGDNESFLTLVYSETNSEWFEIARSIN